MFNIALFQPEIPPNTGNIIRLCANTGCQLHLIKPYSFNMDDKRLRRAGLDYAEFAHIAEHESFVDFQNSIDTNTRIFALTTKAKRGYHQIDYRSGDVLLFGPETRGLPTEILNRMPPHALLRIPMCDQSRSMNLSNAVSVCVYEAWRQQGFQGSADTSG